MATIRIESETKDRFKEYGKMGQSADALLNEIFDKIDEIDKKV